MIQPWDTPYWAKDSASLTVKQIPRALGNPVGGDFLNPPMSPFPFFTYRMLRHRPSERAGAEPSELKNAGEIQRA